MTTTYCKMYSAPLRSRLQVRAPYLEASGDVADLHATQAWRFTPCVITDEDGNVLESNGIGE